MSEPPPPETDPTVADVPLRRLTAQTATVTASAQVVGRALTLVFTVAGTAVVTRAIGHGGFASWGTVLVLTAMVAFLLDPGVAPVVVRRIAQGGREAPAPNSLLAVRLALAAIAYVAVLLTAVALRGDGVLALASVLAAQLVPRAVVMNVGTWMQAEHRLHLQTTLEAVTVGAGFLLLLACAQADASAPVLAAVGVLAPSVVLAALMQKQVKRLPDRLLRPPGDDREKVRSVIYEAAPLAAAIVLVSVYTRIGVVFLNASGDEAGVADFTLSFLLIEQVFVVAAIVAATLLPMLAVRTREAAAASDVLVHALFLAVAVLGAAGAIALIGLAEPIVAVIGGDDFEGAVEVVRLLAPACLAIFANFYIAYLFVAIRRAGRYLVYNMVGLSVSLALGATLTMQQGATAAARVTWITELTVVCCAAIPFLATSAGGRRTLTRVLALMATVVLCSESAVAGWLPVEASAGVAATVVLAIGLLAARRWRATGALAARASPGA